MEINEVQCKSIITESGLPASRYSINPYIGCQHGCVYCYARFMKRYTKHTGEWGSFVDIKINAPSVLAKQLDSSTKTFQGTTLIGSVTDAYQPLERKYKITRALLEVLLSHQMDISILTKSYNVTRDVDLLSQFKSCSVGVTITSLDDAFRKHFEPLASSVKQRIDALKVLKQNSIKTYVFIGPIFPGFTDIPRIVEAVRDYTDSIMAESLNYSCGNWQSIKNVFEKYYPTKLNVFNSLIRNPETWNNTEITVREECKKYGIRFDGFFIH